MNSLAAVAALALMGPQLYCHRTANQDVPENTLASLEYAARLGCNVVEIDIRRTLDGVLILNHDGVLERLTNGSGEIEQTTYAELALYDAGSWMSSRFAGLHIARFEDALHLARSLNLKLILDVKKKEILPEVQKVVEQDGGQSLVEAPWENRNAWVEPGVGPAMVTDLHAQNKKVIANFSANGHEMDLDGMKSAVAAGVDAINVDYPRLGAEAVGRPMEKTLRTLIDQADRGTDTERATAITALGSYRDPDLESLFLHWLAGPLPLSSRAAAVALAGGPVRIERVLPLLQSREAVARANTAWLLGMLHAPTAKILPLLQDPDPSVQRHALEALGRATGTAPQPSIVEFIENPDPQIRGAAALALAHLQPENAAPVILAALEKEIAHERGEAKIFAAGDRKHIDHEQIHRVMLSFRAQMEMVRALGSLKSPGATEALAQVALHPLHEFAQTDGLVAGFQLWERAGDRPELLIQALASGNPVIANRAEWALIKGDVRVLPAVRSALDSPQTQARAMRILAWHGDTAALPQLDALAHSNKPDRNQAIWAAEKIRLLNLTAAPSGAAEDSSGH